MHGKQRREHAGGTYLETCGSWQVFCGGAALCDDGKIRRLKRIAIVADTFFSVPASITAHGKTVAGFVSSDNDGVLRFHAYLYRKNGNVIGAPYGWNCLELT